MEIGIVLLIPAMALIAAVTWGFWQVLRGIGYVIMKSFGAIGRVIKRVAGFIKHEAVEVVQFASAGLSLGFLIPFTLANFITGRPERAKHYASSLEEEFLSALAGAYRIVLAHPLRLVGLGGVLRNVEKRLPSITDSKPIPKMRNMAEAMEFEGYKVYGTLRAGGSGAQLYLAHPTDETKQRFQRRGTEIADEVVIKSFALVNGSTLPQIIRESRALEAANRLGLIYAHDLDEDRFFYVMPYVKGENLDVMIERMHERSGPAGLDRRELASALVYAQDMLKSLDRFHVGGLWHKDVKPANLIVSEGRAHLVDFGLVTPLQSALTLTTHGTEYYRDPEMVRQAMQGVKVHEVDGVKFDLYSAGAVLFSMIENSFPAHGSLSQLSKNCPDALTWVVRRSMADIGSRYRGAWEMLDDLKTIAKARDPYRLRPADLPSMQRGASSERPVEEDQKSNRFGLPHRRGARADAPVPPLRSTQSQGERPPSLPRTQLTGRPGRARSCQRRRRVAGVSLVAVLIFGSVGTALKFQGAGADSNLLTARSEAEAARMKAREVQGLEHSSATAQQEFDFQEGRAIVEMFRPKREGSNVDLVSLSEATQGLTNGQGVYILQDYNHPASDELLSKLHDTLREQGIQLVEEGDDLTRDANLRFLVGSGAVGDSDAVQNLEGFLGTESDLAAVIWLSEGEDHDTGLYEIVMADH